MKKLKKRVFLGLGVLMAAYILFVVYDYLDNQKKVEQSRAFMEESNKVINEYDIISLGVNPNNKTIKVHVPIEEKKRNELAYSLAQIAQKHGMKDYEVILRAIRIRDGYPVTIED
ncbi:hypothetical protein IOC57_22625 [Bacillus sp. SD075]|uniref:hypothetical protein n=1 Tax=Bacillus sp. SD075 TaxID=2781732 RepID=UPI001A979294|nr:hypothetical protein [Bacillus sp. SD075]MBO1000524.1 hypothetical protein [Bacillus sp. SD075]